MLKKSVLFLSLFFLTVSFIWLNCALFKTFQETGLVESNKVNALDDPDLAKATPPVQPDIYIPQALRTFVAELDEEINLRIVVTEVTGDPLANYQVSYYFTGTKYQYGYLGGVATDSPADLAGRSFFNVYATETDVQVLTSTIRMYYGAGGTGIGVFFYDAIKFIMAEQDGDNSPSDLEVLIKMSNLWMNMMTSNSEGRWIRYKTIPDGESDWYNVYMRTGETIFHFAAGFYNNISELP